MAYILRNIASSVAFCFFLNIASSKQSILEQSEPFQIHPALELQKNNQHFQ